MKLEDPSSYVSVQAAFAKIRRSMRISLKGRIEMLSIADAYRRVLASEIVCNTDVPRFDSSHMDGFAIRADDIKQASSSSPARLRVVDRNTELGINPSAAIRKGWAAMIFTGGFLPRGADTVMPLERAEIASAEGKGEKTLTIRSSLRKGSFVRHSGSEIKKGEKILACGKTLEAPDLGLLASLRIFKVPVFAKPRVSIIPTGSELTDDWGVESGKVLNTNSHVIAKIVEGCGCVAFDLGVTPDNISIITSRIRHALETSDMVLTIGGSSVGRHDLVDSAVHSIGKPGMLAHGIKLDRGRVTGLGVVRGKPIIVLPGPIQGAMSASIIFAFPIIRMMSGGSVGEPLMFPAKLADDWQARERFPDFTKVVYTMLSFNAKERVLVAQPLQGETESMKLLVRADSYITVPGKTTSMHAGQIVMVRMLPSRCPLS